MKRRAPPATTTTAPEGPVHGGQPSPFTLHATADHFIGQQQQQAREESMEPLLGQGSGPANGTHNDTELSTPSKPAHIDPKIKTTNMVAFIDGFARFALVAIGPELLNLGGIPSASGLPVEAPRGPSRDVAAVSEAPAVGAEVAAQFATLIVMHTLGRYLGQHLGSYHCFQSKFNGYNGGRWYSRTVGLIMALYLFTLGCRYMAHLYWLRFGCGILIGLLREQTASSMDEVRGGGGSDALPENGERGAERADGADGAADGPAKQRTAEVGAAARATLRGYALGAATSTTSSLVLHLLIQRYRLDLWFGPSTTGTAPLVQWLGYVVVIVMITERLICRYVLKFGDRLGTKGSGGAYGSDGGQLSKQDKTPVTAGRRGGRVLKSALRKVSGCRRRRGGGAMVKSDSESDFDTAEDVELGVSWQGGSTPRAAAASDRDQPQTSLDDSQVYHTPHQHYVPGDDAFHDPLGHGLIRPPSTSDVTVKATGGASSSSSPLFPNEPLMQSPPLAMHNDLTPAPRARAGSTNSARSVHSSRSEVFFDCMSDYSGGDDMADDFINDVHSPMVHNAAYDNTSSKTVAIYRDGKVVYADGRPSHVPPRYDCNILPKRYITTFSPSDPTHKSAKKKWEQTQQWRQQQNVWKIHSTPHPHFAEIKKAYPHFLHGFSKAGDIIVYEQPGKMELKALFRSGCTVDDMVHHYVYLMEYIGNVLSGNPQIVEARRRWCREEGKLESDEPWGIMIVMDVSGAGPSSLSGDVLRYLKRGSDTSAAHYPATVRRAFVVNSPFWLSGIFSGIRGILPESVHVELLGGTSQTHYLTQFIDIDQIPAEYGGTSQYDLGDHPFETGIYKMAEKSNSADVESGLNDLPSSKEDKVPGLVTLESASESAATSATASFDGDGEDGNLVDIPFGSPTAQPVQRTSRKLSIESPYSRNPVESNHGIKPMVSKTSSADTAKRRVLILAAMMYAGTLLSHSMLECSLSLWILSSQSVGGLGYGQTKTTIAVTTCCMLLVWRCATISMSGLALVAGSRKEKIASTFHAARRFRIGAGSTAFFAWLLPTAVTSVPRHESFLVLALSVFLLFCLMIAGGIGRSSARQLQDLALKSCAQSSNTKRYVALSGLSADVSGCILAGSLFGWSVVNRKPFPMNAALCLCVSASVSAVMYILSYWVSTGPSGEFIMSASSANKGRKRGRWLIIIGDVASLIRLLRSTDSAAVAHQRYGHNRIHVGPSNV